MSSSADEIRIRDLANPVLTPVQRAALEYAARIPVRFDVEAVLRAAVERTGLRDFGPDDFRERLGVWMQSLAEDEDLSPIGRVGNQRDAVRRASQRLRLEALLREHPEILEIEIDRPIVIAGLPRSGTTHMVNLISSDRRLRALPLWEAMEPIPSGRDGPDRDGLDRRFVRCRDEWDGAQQLAPLAVAMHPMPPEHVHEEVELMAMDFSGYDPEWRARVPRYRDYYLAHDQRPHYRYLKKILQALTWLRGPNRWVLKSPQHMEQLPVVHEVFPDATIVIPHRDPTAVLASNLTMMAYEARLSRQRVDLQEIARYWIDRIESLLRACVRDRDRIPAPQSFDSPFHEFMKDDIGTIERIYAKAGLETTDAARRAFEAHMQENRRGRHGQVIYDLEGDFGLDVGALRERFAFYIDRFQVAPGV